MDRREIICEYTCFKPVDGVVDGVNCLHEVAVRLDGDDGPESLEAAQRSLARGNRKAATNQLNAFIHEVEALKRGGRLDAATADELIAMALVVINPPTEDAFTHSVSNPDGATDTATVTVSISP